MGERLYCVATDAAGRWLAILVFSAAARHLRARYQWIKWSNQQRRRRLGLITNNSRFLVLPGCSTPNLGSRILRSTLDRLSADWQAHYGHPILVVETFVDPDQFEGTVYTVNGWAELGETDGWGRWRRDYYVKHDKPKRLFVRALAPEACRSLQAEHLSPPWPWWKPRCRSAAPSPSSRLPRSSSTSGNCPNTGRGSNLHPLARRAGSGADPLASPHFSPQSSPRLSRARRVGRPSGDHRGNAG